MKDQYFPFGLSKSASSKEDAKVEKVPLRVKRARKFFVFGKQNQGALDKVAISRPENDLLDLPVAAYFSEELS